MESRADTGGKLERGTGVSSDDVDRPVPAGVRCPAMSNSHDGSASSFHGHLERVTAGGSLSEEEAEAAFRLIMAGEVPGVKIAAFLAALRARGVDPTEVAGGVRALREAMVPVPASEPERVVDTCGTGGGTVTTFNISTAAAFVTAGAGVPVAKHGNRSFTSRSGSADVLEALGVPLDVDPALAGEILEEAGLVFMFAPSHHPAMRHVAPVRKELGIPTVMNLLGPLTNPAGARRQVVGVAEPERVELLARALAALGHAHALVVHGEPGMDEVSPAGRTSVAEVRDGTVSRWSFRPEDVGLPVRGTEELAGGEPSDNARLIEGVLAGRVGGTPRTAVVLNAAAAVYVGGDVSHLADALERAERALDSGEALRRLEALREASRRRSAGG